jgi:hypothetical protein
MRESICDEIKTFLRKSGSKGSGRSRRRLDSHQARRMVAVREARRAFRVYKTQCFWSFDPDWSIHNAQVPLVIQTLRSEGNAQAFALAKRIHKLHAEEGS